MSDTTSTQLEAIHAMMASGHRSVRMERHTLLIWGVAAAFLILVVDEIFTPERFPEVWARALASRRYLGLPPDTARAPTPRRDALLRPAPSHQGLVVAARTGRTY